MIDSQMSGKLYRIISFITSLPPTYVVRREGNVLQVSVCPQRGTIASDPWSFLGGVPHLSQSFPGGTPSPVTGPVLSPAQRDAQEQDREFCGFRLLIKDLQTLRQHLLSNCLSD